MGYPPPLAPLYFADRFLRSRARGGCVFVCVCERSGTALPTGSGSRRKRSPLGARPVSVSLTARPGPALSGATRPLCPGDARLLPAGSAGWGLEEPRHPRRAVLRRAAPRGGLLAGCVQRSLSEGFAREWRGRGRGGRLRLFCGTGLYLFIYLF